MASSIRQAGCSDCLLHQLDDSSGKSYRGKLVTYQAVTLACKRSVGVGASEYVNHLLGKFVRTVGPKQVLPFFERFAECSEYKPRRDAYPLIPQALEYFDVGPASGVNGNDHYRRFLVKSFQAWNETRRGNVGVSLPLSAYFFRCRAGEDYACAGFGALNYWPHAFEEPVDAVRIGAVPE